MTQSKDQRIRERIRCLLSIRPGEQVMRRNFGCDLYAFVHEPIFDNLQPLISFQIQQALQNWVPEVRLESCSVKADNQKGLVEVHVLYTILDEQRVENLQLDLRR